MSAPSARAVTMMTGSSVLEQMPRSVASTSSPLSPGISTSSSTRSNTDVAGERERVAAVLGDRHLEPALAQAA